MWPTLMFLLSVNLPCISPMSHENNHELRLVRDLLKGYNPNVRPVEKYKHTLHLKMHLTVLQLLDVDVRNQIITGSYWLDLFWRDIFLQWTPADYGGIQNIRIYPNQLWRPDLYVYNDIAVNKQDVEDVYRVLVSSDGNITWRVPIIYSTACPLNVTYYPWDKQKCPIIFKSWTLTTKKMNITTVSNNGSTNDFTDGEWTLEEFSVIKRYVALITDEKTLSREDFTHVTYVLKMSRKPLFAFFNVILPSIFIVFCTYLVFVLPPESGEKVSMAVTMLLSTTVFLLLLAEYLPEQSEDIPVINQYFLAAVVLLVLTTGFTVMILYIRFNGSLKITLPAVAEKVILEWLATVVCMRNKVLEIMDSTEFVSGHIKTFIDDDTEQMDNRAYMAWVMAAMVIDRVCLLFFFIGTIVLIVTIMRYHPDRDRTNLAAYRGIIGLTVDEYV